MLYTAAPATAVQMSVGVTDTSSSPKVGDVTAGVIDAAVTAGSPRANGVPARFVSAGVVVPVILTQA